MKGIQFVMDETGEKTAVMIDLKQHGELWEDFYRWSDCTNTGTDEPRESMESVRERLQQQGKLTLANPCG
ncbi:MAG: hypothetical protein SVM79_06960 [Chloroflexota bacterium]|nr:hypothetical protein [Chloroflexota bacterium]